MSGESDPATGVKPMSISGRMVELRYRCTSMTEADRQWRAQYLKDQILSPNEPNLTPELYKSLRNWIRRLWLTPFNKMEKALEPVVGETPALYIRHLIGKTTMLIGILSIGTYILLYHTNDWTKKGLRFEIARPVMLPDEPGYPNFKEKTPQEYVYSGFYSSPYAKIIEKPPPSPVLSSQKKTYKAEEIICEK